jgi:1-acyl-sn-glycerol-3-phosphate acyltransferase
VILVANHGGVMPYDAVVLTHIVRQHRNRQLRPLVEDALFHAPFLGVLLNRMGAVRACPANAERLLNRNRAVLVFPEGTKGTGKRFKDRYKLQRFGRGGFVRLALKTGAPVVPVAVVGAEESSPVLARLSRTAKALGVPHLPISPLPAPAKWQVIFGEPMDLRGQHGPEAARDRLLIGELAESIRGQIQGMLDEALKQRKSPFWG